MDINVYLFIAIALMLLIIMYLLFLLRRVRTQLALIKDALEDIKGGNLNRRILAGENDMTKKICYGINEIAVNSQAQLIRQRQSEQAYKRLMTSLSHDVKTPACLPCGLSGSGRKQNSHWGGKRRIYPCHT